MTQNNVIIAGDGNHVYGVVVEAPCGFDAAVVHALCVELVEGFEFG